MVVVTAEKLKQIKIWGQKTLFCKSLIIRGIGYRAYLLINDLNLTKTNQNEIKHEYTHNRYLQLRAGHTLDLCKPLPVNLQIKVNKKDRKLTLASSSKSEVLNFARLLLDYRGPSAYTGRGVRSKGSFPLRKAGKKDKQKGKTF